MAIDKLTAKQALKIFFRAISVLEMYYMQSSRTHQNIFLLTFRKNSSTWQVCVPAIPVVTA